MRRLLTVLFSLLATLGLVLLFPAVASAHDALQKTTPSDGQSLQQMPQEVRLRFSEPPLTLGTQVLVKGPSGDVATGKPTIEGNDVVQAISTTAPAGPYTVTYRVTSNDGHSVSGTFAFSARRGADPAPSDSTDSTPGTASPTASPTASAGAPATVPTPAATPDAEAASSPTSAGESSSTLPVLLTVGGVIVVIALGAFFVRRSGRNA